MSRKGEIPIEYHGIDCDAKGRENRIERYIDIGYRKVDEILRVYGEITLEFFKKSKNILKENITYIMTSLNVTIEYIDGNCEEQLSMINFEIPTYFSNNGILQEYEISPKIKSLYVDNKEKGKIYIHCNITPY